ncbi:ribosomal protein S5 domain 2-type protein [Hygrophoropsis aurantiaca]|uniref:Ribosomal protein S5 domain 2-type protein n=1 Tax=Hygrophoropsis aurantiaca TaxID=72124 RepID=A0ACB8AJ73_9AGAM|nr:ribosomal protein S5 domain 2-type protein [Hygrophoropsis aurantiaca]
MAASLPIPIFTNLQDLYQNLGTSLNHAERWDNLAKEFVSRFGRKPAYIARAPGRVNLIGEHIDYQLFGVFPAAIEHDILIACAPRSSPEQPGNVVADNLHRKYTRQTFTPTRIPTLGPVGTEDVPKDAVHVEGWHLDIDKTELRWESYVKAGYYGVLNHFFAHNDPNAHPIPVDLLFTGSVPAGSGLSSSAAMVVSSTLAFLAVNGLLDDNNQKPKDVITKGSLVQIAVENEKRVGVNSGGMDQASSVISLANSALYVSFFPKLSAQPIPLPGSNDARNPGVPSATFICANSLVVSDKAVHAKTRYNLRVVETLAAARILAVRLGLHVGPREKLTLRGVLARLMGENEDGDEVDEKKLAEGLKRMATEVECLRPEGATSELGVTLETMVEWSGMGDEAFKDVYLSWVDVEATHFQLYKRAKHVYEEAMRVLRFREVCLDAAASSTSETSVLEALGSLMNESQESCSALCECTCPEIDELTRLAREAGAYGSRVTGAGWGGCTVSLVDATQVDSFIAKIKASYGPYKDLEGDALREVIFATKPSSGACVYKFED